MNSAQCQLYGYRAWAVFVTSAPDEPNWSTAGTLLAPMLGNAGGFCLRTHPREHLYSWLDEEAETSDSVKC